MRYVGEFKYYRATYQVFENTDGCLELFKGLKKTLVGREWDKDKGVWVDQFKNLDSERVVTLATDMSHLPEYLKKAREPKYNPYHKNQSEIFA